MADNGRPVRAAVFGAGRMGRRHLQVLMAAGIDVAGVCDRSRDALDLAASEGGVAPEALFEEPGELFAAVQADLVVVATTAPTHAAFTLLAAESGAAYILCEKPMARSLADCDAMLAACERAGTRLAINHQMRFMEQYRLPKELLASTAFGGLESLAVVAGNFGISMNGSHYVEAFRFVADEPPVEATAWFDDERLPNPRGAEFEDRAGIIRLSTATGRRFYLDASAGQGHGMTAVYAARYGQVVVDELAGHYSWSAREAEHRALPTSRYGMPSDRGEGALAPADVLAPTAAVLGALLDGRDYPTGQDGRLAVAALVAAYESAERGNRSVRIDASLSSERVFPWA